MTHWTIGRHGPEAVPGLRDALVDVHLDARADLLDNPFFSGDRFAERLDEYARDPTFSLVTMGLDGYLVGCAFGCACPRQPGDGTGCATPATGPDPETGSRTFGFRELLVRKVHQRRGYAHRLHDELLADRPEERAALLAQRQRCPRPVPAVGVATGRQGAAVPGQPVFDSMTLDLTGWRGTA